MLLFLALLLRPPRLRLGIAVTGIAGSAARFGSRAQRRRGIHRAPRFGVISGLLQAADQVGKPFSQPVRQVGIARVNRHAKLAGLVHELHLDLLIAGIAGRRELKRNLFHGLRCLGPVVGGGLGQRP